MLSDLIRRLHPSASPPWPALEGTVKADSLALGPVTLQDVSAELHVLPTGVEIASLDAGLFDGSLHLAGSLAKPATDQDKPAYTFEGDFQKLDSASIGALLGLRWAGAPLDGNGKIELAGYTGRISLPRPTAHSTSSAGAEPSATSLRSRRKPGPVPAALGRFDRWTADAAIANGGLTLDHILVSTGARKQSVQATVTFGDPPVVSFGAPKQVAAKQR